ncbi:uncharacterized protein AC631_04330 [Debaryomyces fabryi]|uniref:Uncharacterized protein n=1 Tax=Debaryomyces fabryi TaxID=58627 RepID=A0A0V1PUR9_9ASCO|nr:uncharacterized protein AC631_04330 [Debaryomyces fabryi]KRZ99922.1 hypothetical protein AC631_04330 [Debaryomyces fabryi]CUM51954.1 unnamed protein product [Debaryomyces fabryi]
MNIFNVEDSLEEFDIQYMKAYNQVLNKYHDCTNSARKLRSKSLSSNKKEIASPLLDKHTNRFDGGRAGTFEFLKNSLQSISPTSRVTSKPFGKISKMRPPLKPSVTIESIDTISQSMKPKHLSSPTSPKFRESKCTSGVASFNSYVGNPFYKPSNTRGIKSMPSIPTFSSFNFSLDNTSQSSNFQDVPSICHKKRKVSTESDMQLLVDEDDHPDPSSSDASLSSFDSILSLNDDQFNNFNFDYFMSQENSDMFSIDDKLIFKDYYPFE